MAGNEKLAIPYHDAADEIRQIIEEGKVLQNVEIDFEKDLERAKVEYQSWNKDNERHLLRIFAADDEAKKYKESFSLILKRKIYLSDMVKDFRQLVESKVRLLEAIVSRLSIVTAIDFDIHHDEIFGTTSEGDRKALIIHGSKKQSDSVVTIVEESNMEAIVLRDKKTLLDDLKTHETADHAIFFATNEDVGAQKSKKNNLKPRPGQNAIMEIGYILGILGRERVTVLYEKDLELPRGLKGFNTLKLTAKSWQGKLAKEIRDSLEHADQTVV